MRKESPFLICFLPFAFFFFWALFPGWVMADISHTVKTGESLHGIAQKYHLTVEELLEANKLAHSRIQPDQKLVIPGEKAKGDHPRRPEGVREEESPALQVPKTHKVKKGETLGSIAKRYDLPVNDLRELNELRGKTIKPGQVLQLRLEEDDMELVRNGGEKILSENQDPSKSYIPYIQGSGFPAVEKNRELLGRAAKSFLGVRYSRGGTSVNGMDCSSYVQRVYKIFGIDLPRTAREQFQVGYDVARNALKVGDLVFFRRAQARQPTHVGIYIGNDQMIHTSLKKKQVDIARIDRGYFKTWFLGAKRIEEVETNEAKVENRNSEGEYLPLIDH